MTTKGRLKNTADTLCHMFCGWRQISAKNRLVVLGSGALEIDILTAECYFAEEPISKLQIAQEMRLWFQDELSANHVGGESVSRVRLRVKLSFSKIAWDDRTKGGTFYIHGELISTEEMHRCAFECQCEIVTGARTYRSRYNEMEEWPIGWPISE